MCAGGASVLLVVFFTRRGDRGRERVRFFFGRTFGLWHSRHALVNCRRFLVGQFFWSGDVSRCAPVCRVPCASTGLGSKIVRWLSLRSKFGGRWFGLEPASDL